MVFAQPMNSSTITIFNFTLSAFSSAISGSVSYNAGTYTATFTPTFVLPQGGYTIGLSSAITTSGGVAISPVTSSFNVGGLGGSRGTLGWFPGLFRQL